MDEAPKNSPPRQTSKLVLLPTALLCFTAGALYAWSAMIPALRVTFEVESQQAGMVFSLAILSFSVLVLAAPRLPPALRGLRGGAIAALFGSAALAFAALSTEFYAFLMAYSLGFGGASGTIYILGLEVGGATKTPKIFTALMVAAFGLGGVVFGPVLRLLVVADWGLTALFFPASGLALAAFFALLCPHEPQPVHAKLRLSNEKGKQPIRLEASGQFKTIGILWCGLAFGSVAGLMTLGLATTVIENQGGTAWLSSLALSAIAVGNTAGRLAIGALPRWFPVGWLVPVASGGTILGLMLAIISPNPAIIALGMVTVASGYGVVASSFPVLTQILFGRVRFGRAYSIIFTAWGIAGLISPWLAGLLFDVFGSFSPAFIMAIAASATCLVISVFIKRHLTQAGERHRQR